MELYNELVRKYPRAKNIIVHPLLLKESIVEIDGSNMVVCKYCQNKRVQVISAQLRSTDEGETILNICGNCKRVYQ
jgi:DNA-directed RNA polymerase subunit M/transcription elongation factor TFIIS